MTTCPFDKGKRDMFEETKRIIEKQGLKWIEIHITKPDGLKFALIMEKRAYEKLPKTKLQKLKELMK